MPWLAWQQFPRVEFIWTENKWKSQFVAQNLLQSLFIFTPITCSLLVIQLFYDGLKWSALERCSVRLLCFLALLKTRGWTKRSGKLYIFPWDKYWESRDLNVLVEGSGSLLGCQKARTSLDPLFSVEKVPGKQAAASLLQLQPLHCLCLQGPSPWSEAVKAKLSHMWAPGQQRRHRTFCFSTHPSTISSPSTFKLHLFVDSCWWLSF